MALERLGATINVSRYLKKDATGEISSAVAINKYVSTPEQERALELCEKLDDKKHKELYLSLCKRTRKEIIDEAVSFVIDAHARSKAKLFSWKIKQIRQSWIKAGKNPNRELPAKPTKRKKPMVKNVGEQESLF